MKKWFCIIFIFSAAMLFATPEVRFLGIPWGTPRFAVMEVMEAKGWERSIADEEPLKMYGYLADVLGEAKLYFFDDRFFRSVFEVKDDISKDTSLIQIVSLLTEKYGIASSRTHRAAFWSLQKRTISLITYNDRITLTYTDEAISDESGRAADLSYAEKTKKYLEDL